jgi:Kef-type K+ transport system membrane component KefB
MAAALAGPLGLLVVQTILIVGLSRLIGTGARAIRQPMVIAEIVAGIALGPSLLGWLAPDVYAALFPKASMPALSLLSQLGLILFMFLVGLEFDTKLLKGRGRASVAISHTSIVVPFALGSLLALYLYPRLSAPEVRFSSFTMFMGVAMSITAFPVLARILVERGLLRSRVGAVTITCAAVDDVTAWCILAFIVAVARYNGVADAIRTLVLAVAYIALMLAVVRPFLARLDERARTREAMSQNMVALVLILVLLSAFATELIGIHALFGAFIIGAIIPKQHAFAQQLAEKLEDVVVVLILPLFFAYSGLRTEINLLESASDWVMCALIIAVACLGKFGGSAIAARLTGLSWRESSVLGLLMNTRGLMELIVLNIGLDLGVISPKLFTMMVIMALVTTFVTSPLLEWLYPSSEVAKELAAPAGPLKTRPPVPAYTVVMCVAYDRTGPGMVNVAAALCGDQTASRLYALRLVPAADRVSFVMGQHAGEKSSTALEPLLDTATQLGRDVRPLSFVSARPAEDICRVSEAKQADLVLLGWHKPILGNAVLTGTVHDVMQRATSTVGVLIDHGLSSIRKVLVPYLGGPHDHAALQLAHRLATLSSVDVTVLHVVTPERKGRLGVQDRVEELTETTGSGARETLKIVNHHDPANAALAEADLGYDLVIVGVGPEWGLEHRALGLLSERIIKYCPASLLIVRSRESLAQAPASAPDREGLPQVAES